MRRTLWTAGALLAACGDGGNDPAVGDLVPTILEVIEQPPPSPTDRAVAVTVDVAPRSIAVVPVVSSNGVVVVVEDVVVTTVPAAGASGHRNQGLNHHNERAIGPFIPDIPRIRTGMSIESSKGGTAKSSPRERAQCDHIAHHYRPAICRGIVTPRIFPIASPVHRPFSLDVIVR